MKNECCFVEFVALCSSHAHHIFITLTIYHILPMLVTQITTMPKTNPKLKNRPALKPYKSVTNVNTNPITWKTSYINTPMLCISIASEKWILIVGIVMHFIAWFSSHTCCHCPMLITHLTTPHSVTSCCFSLHSLFMRNVVPVQVSPPSEETREQ